MKKRFDFLSNDLGVDLGSSNVLINMDGKGIVVREPAVVAVDKNTGKVLQVGSAARNMLNKAVQFNFFLTFTLMRELNRIIFYKVYCFVFFYKFI